MRKVQGSGCGQEDHVGRCVVEEAGQKSGQHKHLIWFVDVHLRSQVLQYDQSWLHGDEDADEQDCDFLDRTPGKVVAAADFDRCRLKG